jgi:hypothetical protein
MAMAVQVQQVPTLRLMPTLIQASAAAAPSAQAQAPP